jgi:hypothetical protein
MRVDRRKPLFGLLLAVLFPASPPSARALRELPDVTNGYR